jgi:hypothetical protein
VALGMYHVRAVFLLCFCGPEGLKMKSAAILRRALKPGGCLLLSLLCNELAAASFSSTYLFNTPNEAPTFADTSFSPFTRVGVTAASQAGAFASGGWSDGATRDSNQYVQFTLTPNARYSLSLTSMSFDAWSKNGAVGPTSGFAEILLGSDSKGAVAFSISSTQTTVNFGFAPFNGGENQGITVRFYGWGSKNKNQGELDFDNVTINGNVDPVPEPVNVALVLFGLCFTGIAGYLKLRPDRSRISKRANLHS